MKETHSQYGDLISPFFFTTKGTKPNSEAQSASELYRLSDGRLLAKLVSILTDRGGRMVSGTNPHDR
jgi:hypothetical protein